MIFGFVESLCGFLYDCIQLYRHIIFCQYKTPGSARETVPVPTKKPKTALIMAGAAAWGGRIKGLILEQNRSARYNSRAIKHEQEVGMRAEKQPCPRSREIIVLKHQF